MRSDAGNQLLRAEIALPPQRRVVRTLLAAQGQRPRLGGTTALPLLTLLEHRLAGPLLEADLAEPRALGWYERAFAEHLRRSNAIAGRPPLRGDPDGGLEPLSNELVETKLLRGRRLR